MKLRVYKGDWFFNMGIVGFLNILHKAEVKKQVTINEDYIEFDSELLENFDNYYFDYFIKDNVDYDAYENIYRRLNHHYENVTNKKNIKDSIDKISKVIDERCKEIKNFNIGIHDELKLIQKDIKSIKKETDVPRLGNLMSELKEILELEEIKNRVQYENFRKIVRDNYFGQPSFLNNSNSSANINQLKNIMYKDYISPIVDFHKFVDTVNDLENINTLEVYISENIDREEIDSDLKKILVSIRKKIEKETDVSKIKKFINSKLNTEYCDICGEYYLKTSSYTEGMFAILALSSDNSKNKFWNFENDYKVCAICKLILFCTPAGTIGIDKKYLNSNEQIFYSFVNIDGDIDDIYKYNNHLKMRRMSENPFDDLIQDIVKENVNKSKWILENILFIEFKISANQGGKKCILNYFNMPTYLAKLFESEGRIIQSIYNLRFKANVVDSLLKNKDLKYLISKSLRAKLKDNLDEGKKINISSNDIFKSIKIRVLIDSYKKGVYEMNDKKLREARDSGCKIREFYKDKNSENKINGVVYKLLNAIKVGNKKDFMDTLLRIFMSAEKSVPPVFIEIMAQKDLDFESIGYAFIVGLIPEKYESSKENNKVEEK